MGMFFFWLLFCAVAGALARSMNRSFLGWFMFSLVLSPLLGGVVLLVLGKAKSESEEQQATIQHNAIKSEYELVKAEFFTLYNSNDAIKNKEHINALYQRLNTEPSPDYSQLNTIKTAIEFMR